MQPLRTNYFKSLSDQQLVAGILENNQTIIDYFFSERCAWLVLSISREIFKFQVDRQDLQQELYYLFFRNDWRAIRLYQGRNDCSLMSYIRRISFRHFLKNKKRLIDKEGELTLNSKEVVATLDSSSNSITIMDIIKAIDNVPNPRYRQLLKDFLISELSPQDICQKWKITTDNYYNMKRRALAQLVKILKEEGYHGNK